MEKKPTFPKKSFFGSKGSNIATKKKKIQRKTDCATINQVFVMEIETKYCFISLMEARVPCTLKLFPTIDFEK